MSISGIQSQSSYRTYAALSSGSRINSAADDAAGLAISEKLKTQINGYDVGASNAQDGQNLLNVADGALAGMQDSLQRIRELAVKSMNGTYSDSDREMIQVEIDQLKDDIQQTAKGTSFNEMKLLEGSMADIHLATNPQGGGLEIQLENATLEALGIADFDVTGDFDLNAIDDAMVRISEARGRLGATSNRLNHTINNNYYASYNLTASESRIRDTDYGKEMIKRDTDEALQKYRIFTMRAKKKDDEGILKLFNKK